MHSLTTLPATLPASPAAHEVHLALVGVGLLGLGALLAPRWLERVSPTHRPLDDHEQRVAEVRLALLGGAAPPPSGPGRVEAPADPAASSVSDLLLPLAVVGSLAAAVVHAVMTPVHAEEGALLGVAFAVMTVAQLAWAALATRVGARWFLVAGVVGNLALVALWLVTRTAGLGALLEREEVGPWDVAAVTWELLVVGCCLAALRRAPHARLAAFGAWNDLARAGAVVSLMALAFLPAMGMHG